MRTQPIIMLALAVVFGGASIMAGQRWISRQGDAARQAVEAPAPAPVARTTVVVTAVPLRFGTEITPKQVKEIAWPADAVPAGAFRTVAELVEGQHRRVALAAMEVNEPIMATKITGPGQRGTLAALIEPGFKAVTIRVNDVNGVAGFILPGERVDVISTRVLEKGDAYADVLLQNTRVLAIDQIADDRADKPSLAKAVTLEVSTDQAQKLALAGTVGTLSLTLRAAGVASREDTRRVSVDDLARPEFDAKPVPVLVSTSEMSEPRRSTTVGVTRGMKRQEYSVPASAVDVPSDFGTASLARRAP